MNYETSPDIDPHKPLTADAVYLFQRFQQDADREALDKQLEHEVERHLKLCEAAILYYASCSYYWCELPRHPISDVNTWACQELEKRGFTIEHHSVGVRRKVSVHHDRKQEIEGVEIRTYSTASWANVALCKKREQEWRRREALEDAERKKNAPRPCSKLSGVEIIESDAVWSGVLDGKFLVEVQRIHQRHFLCIFELAGKCLHCEETNVAFGAMFGPDIGDVAAWQERAVAVVSNIAE